MTPTRAQRAWCAQYLPAVKVRVIDLIPRAYCVAKPAVGYAVLVTPQVDYAPHNAASRGGNDPFYSAVSLRNPYGNVGSVLPTCEIVLGQWMTLAFIERQIGGTDWVALPLIPLSKQRTPKQSVKTGTIRR